MKLERGNILGVKVSAIDMRVAIDAIFQWIERRTPQYICVTPAHSIMDCWLNPDLYPLFNNSGLTTPDGMSVVWLLHLQGYKQTKRVTGTDLMLQVLSESERTGWRHFFYGSTPETLHLLKEKITRQFPAAEIVGMYAPPFRELTPEEDEAIIARIKNAHPDILWVGISSPKQERWMAAHLHELEVPVLIGVGAAFDFVSGVKKRAPVWMQRLGLEWLYRFLSEPARLWPRYRWYPLFILLSCLQLVGIDVVRKSDKVF
jgi:N-acetylglucosaminyldiphosphoundecaprenol N-acetyl-beta-D-mannosaminyltransferase